MLYVGFRMLGIEKCCMRGIYVGCCTVLYAGWGCCYVGLCKQGEDVVCRVLYAGYKWVLKWGV